MAYRLSDEDAEDIRWYEIDSEGEMGRRGVNCESFGGGSGECNDIRTFCAVQRWRRIRGALDAIPALHARALCVYYAGARPLGLEAFGTFGGVACISPEVLSLSPVEPSNRFAKRDLETWLHVLSARLRGPKKAQEPGDQDLLTAINRACDELVGVASSRYSEEAPKVRKRMKIERDGKHRADVVAEQNWRELKAQNG